MYVTQRTNRDFHPQMKVNKMTRSYLEGAAIAVELTAHLSFGTVVLVTGQLKHEISQSISSIQRLQGKTGETPVQN